MSATFSVIFRGDIAPGATLAEVRQRLQDFFNLDDARAGQLFSGRPVTVKKNVERDKAEQFRALLAGMGALAELRDSAADNGPSSAAPSAPRPVAVAPSSPPPTAPASGLDGVTVEPPGADVLRPGERRPDVHRDVATGHLSLDSPGADILKPHERQKPVEVHLDLSRLRVEPADDA